MNSCTWSHENPSRNFDHIIIGGGAAGCVVAARLSEDPSCEVLLVEAGPDPVSAAVTMPFGVFDLQRGDLDWCDTTIPQAELNQREIAISAGKALGGGGSINFMAWYRGHPSDYDSWATQGMDGWGWKDVLPYFRRSEDHELGCSQLHMTGGPMPVSTSKDISPMSIAFVAAGPEYGLTLNRDFNGSSLDGVGLLYSNIRRGERVSAAEGYLRSARERNNLTVLTETSARRILLSGTVVNGALVTTREGETFPIYSKSVVLSAGPLRSPQLLMLSGIGPAKHLSDLGIEVSVDLPGVGLNLHDHLTSLAVWPVIRGVTWAEADTANNRDLYTSSRRGPLASMGQVGAFLRCGDGVAVPNIELTPMLMDFTKGPHCPGFTCMVTLLVPESRGRLRLRSSNPSNNPIVDPRYLRADVDRRTLVEGVRQSLEICGDPSLSSFIGRRLLPNGAVSNEDILATIRSTSISMNHPAGTCRAGNDQYSVVDPQLKVHGVDGLRIIDSSIMPNLPRANTHAPSIMIGERGVEFIRTKDLERDEKQGLAVDVPNTAAAL